MPEIQTVILNVEEGKRKDGSTIVSKTGSKLHKIKVDAYSEDIACWDPAMSQVASSFIGKQVVLDVGSKPAGTYQNYTLYAIRLDGDGTVTLEPNKIPAPVSEAAQPTRGTMDDATVLRITRLSCLSSACTLAAGNKEDALYDEVIELAEVFVNYAFNGRSSDLDALEAAMVGIMASDDIAVVRSALQTAPVAAVSWIADEGEPAMAALDRLEARLRETGAERDEARDKAEGWKYEADDRAIARAEYAEAEVARLEAEIAESGKYVLFHRWKRRAEAAEARAEAARP